MHIKANIYNTFLYIVMNKEVPNQVSKNSP